MRVLSNTGGAGSSGHVITDGTTNFEDREFLQFDDVDIQDDLVNNKTIIKPQFRVVTEAEWNLMSPAERNNPNVYWVRPWMSSNEYSSDMSPVGTVISVSCAKTEDGATDSQGDPIYTPSGIYPPESDYLVCDGATIVGGKNVSKQTFPKLAEYFQEAYGNFQYFGTGAGGTDDFSLPDWSADFPENGILCIKAQISSTAITYAEIDQSGIYAGEDKVPSCARVAEIEKNVKKNNLSGTIYIPSGTDYVIPANGFLSLYVKSRQELDVHIYGSNKTSGGNIRKDYINPSDSGVYDCIYLLKGMIVNCTYTSTQGSLMFNYLA